MMMRRSWRDLSPRLRVAVAVLAPVEIALTTLAVVDLARRSPDQVRGRKALWWPTVLIQPLGPIAYLWWGRQRGV
jgi:hypothetical protein